MLVAALVLTLVIFSCRHEMPTPSCDSDPMQLSVSKTDATNNQANGSIAATATGGTGFQYSLNGAAFQDDGNFMGLEPFRNYILVARNSWGCTDTATVSIEMTDPCAGVTVAVSAVKTDASPNQSNGSITVSATGGTGFTYSINGGAFQTSNVFANLAAGNYDVTAKNSNGCLGTKQVVIAVNNPCTGVTVVVNTTQVNPTTGQSNGSITATATGGTGFTYSLSNGTYQASGTFTGLAAGNYTVTAKNSTGCLGSTQVTLIGTNPCSATTITITTAIVSNTPCVTPATGKITVTAAGSTGFTYNINGGAYQVSNVFSGLATGNYTVGVKDANGCTKTAAVSVTNVASGPLFAEVRNIITNRCSGSGCHMNGANAAGYNFDNDCSVVSQWSKINSSSVTGNSMPKSPQPKLTAAEKLKITTWINAGHRYTD